MSEELDKKETITSNHEKPKPVVKKVEEKIPDVKTPETKNTVTKEVKVDLVQVKESEKPIVEKYQYKGEGELIMDKPSIPLKPKTNKQLYESYIRELVNFSLSVNNEVLYDSTLDRKKEIKIRFEDDYFILYGKKYSYNGLKIKKIN